MKHLKTGDLVQLTGYSRASIARMARSFQIPGVCAPDGVHFAFEDSPDLQDWIQRQRERRDRFRGNRPTWSQSSLESSALSAGVNFHQQLNRLVFAGHTDSALKLVAKMQVALEKVRAKCERDSWANGEQPDPESN